MFQLVQIGLFISAFIAFAEIAILSGVILYGEIRDLPVNEIQRKAKEISYTNIIKRG